MMATVDNDGHPSVEFQATEDDFAAAYQLHFAHDAPALVVLRSVRIGKLCRACLLFLRL